MKGHNNFFNNKYAVAHKVKLSIKVDYLPGDIFAYTDRAGWHNIFIKDEFYARTKSERKMKEWVKQMHHWMMTDFFDLKSPEAQKEQTDHERVLLAQHSTLLIQIEDTEAYSNRLKDTLAQLKFDHPCIKFTEDRQENEDGSQSVA